MFVYRCKHIYTYVSPSRDHRTIIFIEEAFVGPLLIREARLLTVYVSYVHPVRNGLITYARSSAPHHLLRTSHDGMIFQLLEIKFGVGTNLAALSPPTLRGMISMRLQCSAS